MSDTPDEPSTLEASIEERIELRRKNNRKHLKTFTIRIGTIAALAGATSLFFVLTVRFPGQLLDFVLVLAVSSAAAVVGRATFVSAREKFDADHDIAMLRLESANRQMGVTPKWVLTPRDRLRHAIRRSRLELAMGFVFATICGHAIADGYATFGGVGMLITALVVGVGILRRASSIDSEFERGARAAATYREASSRRADMVGSLSEPSSKGTGGLTLDATRGAMSVEEGVALDFGSSEEQTSEVVRDAVDVEAT